MPPVRLTVEALIVSGYKLIPAVPPCKLQPVLVQCESLASCKVDHLVRLSITWGRSMNGVRRDEGGA